MLFTDKKSLEDDDHIIITMFVSSEYGIRMQDIKSVDNEARLIGVCTPFIIILKKLAIFKEVMSDFNGLESCNKETRKAVLDFSYNLSLGICNCVFYLVVLLNI